MRTFTTLLFLTSSLAFGQKEVTKPNRVAASAAKQVWAAIQTHKGAALAPIAGAAIITEPELNGYGSRFWLSVSQPGIYAIAGITCAGDEMNMGVYDFFDTHGLTSTVLMLDTGALQSSIPGLSSFCRLDVYHTAGGVITQLLVHVQQSDATNSFDVIGEGIKAGSYLVGTSSIDPKATVILGRFLLPRSREDSRGATTFLFRMEEVPRFFGELTLTVCSRGTCQTKVIPRNAQVWGIPPA